MEARSGQPCLNTNGRLDALFRDDADKGMQWCRIKVEVGNLHRCWCLRPDLIDRPWTLGRRGVARREKLLTAAEGIDRHLGNTRSQGDPVGSHLVDQAMITKVVSPNEHELGLFDQTDREGIDHEGHGNTTGSQFSGHGTPLTHRPPLSTDHAEAPTCPQGMA